MATPSYWANPPPSLSSSATQSTTLRIVNRHQSARPPAATRTGTLPGQGVECTCTRRVWRVRQLHIVPQQREGVRVLARGHPHGRAEAQQRHHLEGGIGPRSTSSATDICVRAELARDSINRRALLGQKIGYQLRYSGHLARHASPGTQDSYQDAYHALTSSLSAPRYLPPERWGGAPPGHLLRGCSSEAGSPVVPPQAAAPSSAKDDLLWEANLRFW
jgi:hypothetical protein